MQEVPPAPQVPSYAFQAPQSTTPQVNHPGVQTASQATTSQVGYRLVPITTSPANTYSLYEYPVFVLMLMLSSPRSS